MCDNKSAASAEHASPRTYECTPAIDTTSDASPTYSKDEIRPIIKKCVEAALVELDKQYEERFAALNARLANAEALNKSLRERLDAAEERITAEEGRINGIERMLEQVKKELQTKEEDLDAAHPLPQPTRLNMRRNSQQQQSPVLIARFHRRDQRDAVIKARPVLKGSGIVVSEDLTKKNQELLRRLHDSNQYTSSWSWMGKIFAIPLGETRPKKMSILDTIPNSQ